MTKDEMGGECCTYEGEEKCVCGFMWKLEGKRQFGRQD
jgi:hypothetical protein